MTLTTAIGFWKTLPRPRHDAKYAFRVINDQGDKFLNKVIQVFFLAKLADLEQWANFKPKYSYRHNDRIFDHGDQILTKKF